jgi:hypothetical protein
VTGRQNHGAPIGWALKLGFYRVFSRKNKRCMQNMSQIGVYLIKGSFTRHAIDAVAQRKAGRIA